MHGYECVITVHHGFDFWNVRQSKSMLYCAYKTFRKLLFYVKILESRWSRSRPRLLVCLSVFLLLISMMLDPVAFFQYSHNKAKMAKA